jgi:GTP-binding protein EngB required for normal cell division
LLELIESLKTDQLDRYDIDLPQIIVCGDQSCGKSSVLEAISRLNFPRGDLVCTTFATELTLRREPAPGIAVKIRWEDGSVEVIPKSQSIAHFGELIIKAGEGLRKRYKPDREKPFYRDVLQVEVCDPAWPPLTLVDLPGLIHAPNNGQDKRDIKIAEDITKTYMKKSKTIILAVVSAASNFATQQILTLAKTYDPTGERTMGIITKPDKLEGSRAEAEWIRIAKNKSDLYKFGYGWHVVRNRGVEEMDRTFDERDAQELEFFSHSSWAGKLDPNQLGIDSLRIRLSRILEDQTRSTLPGIIKQLRYKLEESRLQLKRLGPSRLDMDEKLRYLSIISDRFQRLIYQATAGQYEDVVFATEESMKLRAIITEKHEQFVQWMEGWGHTFEEQGKRMESRCPPPIITVDKESQELTLPDVKTRTELVEWVRQIQVKNRSRELPGFANWYHINLAFRQQCQRWRQIATAHIEAAWKATYGLLHQVTKCAAENAHTATALEQFLISPWMKSKHDALMNKLNEILRPYEIFHAITFNPEFIRKRNELYAEMLEDEKKTITKVVAGGNGDDEPEIKKRLSRYNRKTNEYASSSSEILDLMHAYYNVSSAISSLQRNSTDLIFRVQCERSSTMLSCWRLRVVSCMNSTKSSPRSVFRI